MNWLRWLCLVAVFCLDVHVRAEGYGRVDHRKITRSEPAIPVEFNFKKWISKLKLPDLPSLHDEEEFDSKKEEESCWGNTLPCTVYASHGKKVLSGAGMELVLGTGTLVEFRSGDIMQLVTGNVYVEISKPLKINTPYGKVWCPDQCRALITRRSATVKVQSLDGTWIIERLGEDSQYALNAGTQIWLSEVNESGKSAMEFPQSLPWDPTVKSWASLYPGEPEDFKQALVKFRKVWKEAVEAVSEVHNQAADRNIASHNQELSAQAAREKVKEKEQQDLRERYRLQTLGQ